MRNETKGPRILWRYVVSATAVLTSLLIASLVYAVECEYDMDGVAKQFWVPEISRINSEEVGSWHIFAPLPSGPTYAIDDTNKTDLCIWIPRFQQPFSTLHTEVIVDCMSDLALVTIGTAGAFGDTVVIKNIPPGRYGIGSKIKYPAGEYRRLIITEGRVLKDWVFWTR